MDEEAKSIQNQIKGLQTRLEFLERQRENYRSYLSPFRRLPTEVLSEIILIYLDNYAERNSLMQICHTIRDIIIGMRTLWSTITLCRYNEYNISKRDNPCFSVGQLRLALERAYPSPLNLRIYSYYNEGLMELLFSHNPLIRSLRVDWSHGKFPIEGLGLLCLNELKSLELYNLSENWVRYLMSLAMQSSHKKMTLSIHSPDAYITELLRHDLLQRVASLSISSKLPHHARPSNIHLPQVRSLTVASQDSFTCLFHPTNIAVIKIGASLQSASTLKFLGNRLTTLSLVFVDMTAAIVPEQEVFYFPNLERLELRNVRIEGPLRHYLRIPKLRHLDANYASFYPFGSVITARRVIATGVIMLSDALLSPTHIGLKTISLVAPDIDDNLAMVLRSCEFLCSIALEATILDKFTSSFIQCQVSDPRSFPSLNEIIIGSYCYWTDGSCITQEEFAEHCAARRPCISLYI